jgi:hypothetical protein
MAAAMFSEMLENLEHSTPDEWSLNISTDIFSQDINPKDSNSSVFKIYCSLFL